MLTLYTRDGRTQIVSRDMADTPLPPDVVWLDLLEPAAHEVAYVQRAVGLAIPSFEVLSEIESSSRLRVENGALMLSTPLIYRGDTEAPRATPVGFILTRERLVTVRFEALRAFSTFADSFARQDARCDNGAMAFTGLAEAIVDRLADVLENMAAELDALSHRLFGVEALQAHSVGRPAHQEAKLRASLQQVGRSGDLLSKIRDSLLGIGRVVPFVAGHGADWIQAEVKANLETLRHDVASLSDYNVHLTNKIQLLLDATLGLINIEQSTIIKVLTVVSVVGVPPTLIASMYGMNFKHMPELDWGWGYPYGLLLILLSAVLPILWFKRRGWL
jgi:magnesium transporter